LLYLNTLHEKPKNEGMQEEYKGWLRKKGEKNEGIWDLEPGAMEKGGTRS